MRVNDALTGGVLLVLALALGLYSQTLPPIPGQEYGAAVFPTTVALGLGLLAIVLIVQGVRGAERLVAWSDWARSHHGPLNFILAVLGVLAFVYLSGPLGFLPTMALILLVLFLAVGTGWRVAVPVAALVTFGLHLTFVDLLKVPLPWGVVPPFSW